MRTVQQGSEKSLTPARRCVEVRVHAASVPLSHKDSRVCGKIIGYQFGRTNGLLHYISDNTVSIDTAFVDGIVLTHGSPRAHIWTFVAGHDQISTTNEDCPCNSNSFSGTLPPYIGNDYFCDSAHTVNNQPPLSHLTNDHLWVLAVLVAPAVPSTLLRGSVRASLHQLRILLSYASV